MPREAFIEVAKEPLRNLNAHEGHRRFVLWIGDAAPLFKMSRKERLAFMTMPAYRGKVYFFESGDDVCSACAEQTAKEILRHDCVRAEDEGRGFYIMDGQHYIESRSPSEVMRIFAHDLKEEVIRIVEETEASDEVQDVGLLCWSCDRVMATAERVMKIVSK